jgi:hypothetical protein
LGGFGDCLGHVSADFADVTAPRNVIESVIEQFGAINPGPVDTGPGRVLPSAALKAA